MTPLYERTDVAGEDLEGTDHLRRLAIARLHEDVAHPQGLVPLEVTHDLLGRSLKRLAIRAARARAESEAGAQGDGQLLEAPALPRALLAQLAKARLQAFGRGEAACQPSARATMRRRAGRACPPIQMGMSPRTGFGKHPTSGKVKKRPWKRVRS